MKNFVWKSIVSFAVSLIRPTLDVLIYLKTQLELQEIWGFYYGELIFKKIDVLINGKTEEPCWEMRKIYEINQGKSGMPIYIQKTPIGFWVWSQSSSKNLDDKIFNFEKMKPCFISIRYIGENGAEFDIDLGPEFYVSGNELLSAGFVKWWIRTRFGEYWTNYSPGSPYKIVLMDKSLNELQLGSSDAVVLNSKGFTGGNQYKKIHFNIDNLHEYEE